MATIVVLLLATLMILAVAQAWGRRQAAASPAPQKIIYEATPTDRQWRQMCSWLQNVMGEQYHRDEIRAWAAASDRALDLVREPANDRDPNAIAVIGVWDGGVSRARLGYLARELAAEIAATRPEDMPLQARPHSLYIRGDFLDLKIKIFEPAARSTYWRDRGLAAPMKIESQYGRAN